jgi:hypothetical protein
VRNVFVAALAIVLVEHCMPFGQPLTVHCSVSRTAVTRFASSINFIRSDEVDGLDINGSTSIASLQELIFAREDVGGGEGFCEEAFRVLGFLQDETI